MNKTTKLFAIALLLVASTSLMNAGEPESSAAAAAAAAAATVAADAPAAAASVDGAAPSADAGDAAAADAPKPGRIRRGLGHVKSGAKRAKSGVCGAATWDYPVQRAAGISCLKDRCQCVRNDKGNVKSWISVPIMYAVYTAGIVTVYAVAKKIAEKFKNKDAKALDLGEEELA